MKKNDLIFVHKTIQIPFIRKIKDIKYGYQIELSKCSIKEKIVFVCGLIKKIYLSGSFKDWMYHTESTVKN